MRFIAPVGEDSASVLKGKRVVVTRAAEQSEPLLRALREKGAVTVLAPMMVFAPPDDPGALDEAMRGMEGYDWMFLTSQNAVRALQGRGELLGVSLGRAMRGIRIATVGPATAETARNAGLRVEYVAVKHQGAALAEELAEKVKGKHILLPRSDRANPELVEKLEGFGAKVKEIVAYKTVLPEEKAPAKAQEIARQGADAVLFFSPSAVHHLEELLGSKNFLEFSRRSLFAAIGPVTEEALRKAKVEHVVQAKDATVDAVLAALTDYFSAGAAKLPAGAKPQ
jgi:uroporphyrinogen-III synthase